MSRVWTSFLQTFLLSSMAQKRARADEGHNEGEPQSKAMKVAEGEKGDEAPMKAAGDLSPPGPAAGLRQPSPLKDPDDEKLAAMIDDSELPSGPPRGLHMPSRGEDCQIIHVARHLGWRILPDLIDENGDLVDP